MTLAQNCADFIENHRIIDGGGHFPVLTISDFLDC